MKKYISTLLALVMVFSLTACGGTAAESTEAPALKLEGTMEELVTQVVEKNPVEFMGDFMPTDLTDTSEDGIMAIQSFTGLQDTTRIQDIAAYEPMMGSIAFSLVMVRVNEGEDVAAVAGEMKSGIDQRKWICVEADDLMLASFGDVVMLIMVASSSGMTAQSFVDAFQSVCAAQYEGAEVIVH